MLRMIVPGLECFLGFERGHREGLAVVGRAPLNEMNPGILVTRSIMRWAVFWYSSVSMPARFSALNIAMTMTPSLLDTLTRC